MSVRQWYYTSYVNKKTGSAGFQIKALSPGISADLQATLVRLIAYRVPPTLDIRALQTHPVALRYYYAGPGECILLCSQSCGNDEYGRPGNFFSHGLILEPDFFRDIPPIFFWKSPFWRIDDPEERYDCISLPILPSFDEKPTLALEEIWSFLAQSNRHALFYKLLCAVIRSSKTQRRIVILDTNEHVAWWIAAISCFLPPDYRPFLTFATYHHDAYANHYLITGTTRDFFAASAQDHLSFFVLDAELGRASPVESSPYAELAVEALRNECYESLFLPLFATYARRFPTPIAIDEQLDHLALYARIQRTVHYDILSQDVLDAIHATLPAFEREKQHTQEDSEELCHIEEALRETMRASPTSALRREYCHVLTLLREQRPTSLDRIIFEELTHFTEKLLTEDRSAIASFDMPIMCQLYGEECVTAVMNSAVYLRWLVGIIERATLPQLLCIWNSFGDYIRPGSLSLRDYPSLPESVRAVIDSAIALSSGQMTLEQAEQLRRATARLSCEEYLAVLRSGLSTFFCHDISHEAHLHLIQALFPRSVELMMTGRFWQVYQDTLAIMLQQPATMHKAIEILDFWFSISPNAFSDGYPVQQFFLLLPTHENLQRSHLSREAKETFRRVAALRPWYPSLRGIFSERKSLLTTFTQQFITQYQGRSLRWPMSKNRIEDRDKKHALRAEVDRLFTNGDVLKQHYQCARLYQTLSPAQFWPLYWKRFMALLASGDVDRLLSVLLFWFDHSYSHEEPMMYLHQEFFLGLPGVLEVAATRHGFHETAQAMRARGNQYQWYRLLAQYFEREEVLHSPTFHVE